MNGNSQNAGKASDAGQWGALQGVVVSANSFWNIANFRETLVRALTGRGYRVVVATPEPDTDWAVQRGVETAAVDIDRSGLNPFSDMKSLLEYLRIFYSKRPKFYLSFTAKPNIYGSMAARLAGVSAIPNVSGLGTAFMGDGLLSRLVSGMYRFAFRKCPIVFFQNTDDRDMFIARKIVKSEQARILPGSGIDLERFAPPAHEPDKMSFLYVGRVLGDKGVREFVDAARVVRAAHPEWTFRMLGAIDTGNRTSISRAEIDRWVEEGAVDYLGETDDVRPFVGQSTAVVLPSYREGLPRSLLEAAAMARPLIATDVAGNRQLVRHGENGLLCKARDAQSLADALLAFGSMTADRRLAMGRSAREIVEASYGEELVISAYLGAMKQLGPTGGV